MKKSLFKVVSLVLCFAMVFCSGVIAGAEDAVISRISCVVNGDASTSRGFTWFTNVDCGTDIFIYENGIDVTNTLTITYESEKWEGNYMHKAYVSGLKAGTEYTYQVGNGMVRSDFGSFTTDNADDSVDFIVVADVQASNAENFEKGQKVTEKAFEIMPDADFYANLGDYTNDSTNEEWDLYATAFDAINANTTQIPVAGNHDSNSGWFNALFALDTSESVQVNNGVNYSFDYGNVHVAVLNTNDMIAISNAQLIWLENDMNSTDKDWKIVFLHKSAYSLGKDIKWPDACYLQETVAEVCDKTNVDLVMSGHDHMYVRTKPLNNNAVTTQDKGTTYVLAGTAGAKRYEFRTFILNNYIPADWLDVAIAQANGAYLADGSLDNLDESYKGGVFNTVSIDGGELNLTSYVLSDDGEKIKVIDEFSISKAQGENKATFTGDNTTSSFDYMVDQISSLTNLAIYAFTKWLPMFFKTLPDLLSTYAATGTF